MNRQLPAIPLGIPQHMESPDAFNTSNRGKFDVLCNEVVALKKSGSGEYQQLKLMGDAYLKSTVYGLLKRHGDKSIEFAARTITGNDASCAMPLFFDKHLGAKHNQALPNERGQIDSHAKADVVEALLELARRKKDTFAFIFIIKELFILANRGEIVNRN